MRCLVASLLLASTVAAKNKVACTAGYELVHGSCLKSCVGTTLRDVDFYCCQPDQIIVDGSCSDKDMPQDVVDSQGIINVPRTRDVDPDYDPTLTRGASLPTMNIYDSMGPAYGDPIPQGYSAEVTGKTSGTAELIASVFGVVVAILLSL